MAVQQFQQPVYQFGNSSTEILMAINRHVKIHKLKEQRKCNSAVFVNSIYFSVKNGCNNTKGAYLNFFRSIYHSILHNSYSYN